VASFGDAMGTTPGALEIVHTDATKGTYAKVVLSDDAKTLLGGVLVGDAAAYTTLKAWVGREYPGDPAALISPAAFGEAALGSALPDDAVICSCNNVTKASICGAIAEGACDLAAIKGCTSAGTTCGGCLPTVGRILADS